MQNLMKFSKEVKEAKEKGIPIVALESTIICHGMPYPQNLQTAQEIEKIIRDSNCVPATICIIKGIIHVGLDQNELKMIAQSNDFMKLSTRDLSYCIAMKKNGATTVATTTRIANIAGIKVFATGGIGGVHRDFKDLLDVSNDLEELGQNQMCIVCAGAKSILDLPKTLEYLETKGVTLFGYQTQQFPAFFTTKSGLKCQQIDTPNDIANVMNVQFDILNIKKCIVIANPISEDKQADGDMIEQATLQALTEMKQQNINGKQSTPFLLKRIAQITNNKSLNSNIELVKSNTKLASEIAKSYLKL